MKTRKIRSDTVAGQIKAHEKKRAVRLPAGLILRKKLELQLWEHYTTSREPDAWRAIDLVQIWKVVKHDIRIIEFHKQIDKEGLMVPGQYGDIPNPAISALDREERTQLTISRSLSLTIRGNDAIALNAGGDSAIDKAVDKEDKAQMYLFK